MNVAVGFVASPVVGVSSEIISILAPHCANAPEVFSRLVRPQIWLGTFYSTDERVGIVNLLVTLIILN